MLFTCSQRFIERFANDAGIGTLSIADDAGFVNVLPGHSDIAS
jgi:hypothetical protein